MTNMDYVYKYWFPHDVKEIYIISSRDGEPTEDAYMWSDDYAYLDSFGDKDLLFLVYGFIRKYYPETKIQYFPSSLKCQRELMDKNLIILGGPSAQHVVAREFMHTTLKEIYQSSSGIDKPPLLYSIKRDKPGFNFWKGIKEKVCKGKCKKYDESFDCRLNHEICIWRSCDQTEPELMFIERGSIVVTEDEAKNLADNNEFHKKNMQADGVAITECIKKDIGVFAAFLNPNCKDYNSTRVIMINGAHTFGGVGAFMTFNTENEIALNNYYELDKFLDGKGKDFISFFPIEVGSYARTCNQCAKLKVNENFISLVTPQQQEAILEENLKLLNDLKNNLVAFEKSLSRIIKSTPVLTGGALGRHKEKVDLAKELLEEINIILQKLRQIKQQKDFDNEFSNLQTDFNISQQRWADFK